MDIYEAIVSGLKEQISGTQPLDLYLQSLQKSVKALRIAYRNNPVHVPYEKKDIQSAYLATYFPHYYQLIYKIFIEEVPDIFKSKKAINLTFIGGGPGPEAFGAIKYILNNCPRVELIRILILDINASTWDYSHSILSNNLIPSINDSEIEIHWDAIQFDLTSNTDIKKVILQIKQSDLLVIQNCLNEIANLNLPLLKDNLKLLFETLPNEAYLLMSDMTSVARHTIKILEEHLVDKFAPKFFKSTLSSSSPRSLISVHHKPSPIIAQNLLIGTDGLIPRKNISYDYSILSKGISEQKLDFSDLGFAALYRPLDFKNLDPNNYIHKKVFIGIDFGTSSTVVSSAQLSEGKIIIKTIPVKQKDHLGSITRSPLVPSVISFVNGNRLLVGVHAADHKPFLEYGKNTWHSFKQHLGKLEEVKYPNSVLTTSQTYKISCASEAISLFFTYIKREIFEYLRDNNLSTDVEYSVSVPAGFTSAEKKNLRKALLIAGIDCEDIPLIEEPNAALINYLFEQNIFFENNRPKTILVLDLGAGTVDVSVVRAENSIEGFTSKLLSVVRIGNIGGNLIDELIADYILKKIDNHNSLDLTHRIELISMCEKLKIKMCKDIIVDSATNFNLPAIYDSNEIRSIPSTPNIQSLGLNNISLSFNELNQIMSLYWLGSNKNDGVKTTLEKSIENARTSLSSIDKVIVTGGGGRNPYIKYQIADYFINSEIFISDNIQEQVSRGVALHSFVLNSFGKNIITPILAHDIYLKGSNKSLVLFENGITIPSIDIEVSIDATSTSDELSIECYSKQNLNYFKYFIIPANRPVEKLVFYLTPDQDLKCEMIGNNYESEITETFTKPILNLIKIK